MARTLVQLLQSADTASRANGIFHDAPEAFDGMQRVSTTGWEAMETTRAGVMVACRVELMRPRDPPAVDDHHDLFLGGAEDRHHLVARVAQVLRIEVGHKGREDFRGAILDRTDDVQQAPAADPAPGAMLRPDLAFERFFPFDALGLSGRVGRR